MEADGAMAVIAKRNGYRYSTVYGKNGFREFLKGGDPGGVMTLTKMPQD